MGYIRLITSAVPTCQPKIRIKKNQEQEENKKNPHAHSVVTNVA